MRTRRRAMLGFALATAIMGFAAMPSAASPVQPTYRTPGVYVTEQDAFGNAAVTPAGVSEVVAIGSGMATTAEPGPQVVTSAAQFASSVNNPSARLSTGVAAFFAAGGTSLTIVLTPDESAASLTAALASLPSVYGVVTVPALGELTGSAYASVAAALDENASQRHALAFLDPSDAAVSSAVAGNLSGLVSLASQLRAAMPAAENAVLFASGLVNSQQESTPTALAIAGQFQQSSLDGTPAIGGLQAALPGYQPTFSTTNAGMGVLHEAEVNPLRYVPGQGTVLWGQNVLSAGAATHGTYLTQQALINQINVTVQSYLQPMVFAPNNGSTWATVTSGISQYLNGLWATGNLSGDKPSDAYAVVVGLGTTMTEQDIQDGYMIVSVEVTIGNPPTPVQLRFTQIMGS